MCQKIQKQIKKYYIFPVKIVFEVVPEHLKNVYGIVYEIVNNIVHEIVHTRTNIVYWIVYKFVYNMQKRDPCFGLRDRIG